VVLRLATPRTAVLLGGLVALLFAVTIPVALVGHDMGGANGASQVVLVAAFGLVGAAVAWSRPRNPIGWCLLGAAGALVLSDLGSTYSVLDYRKHHGSLPLGPVAVMIQPGWAPAIVLLALSIVLFPDGELPSGRWRWPMALFLGVGLVWLGGAFAIALAAIAGGHVDVLSSGDLRQTDYPSGSWAGGATSSTSGSPSWA
jgi:hypothetical protein